ncbi:MAG: alpha-2-macroglobulin family protein, partial [Spirochaetota bacterium]
SLPVETVRPNRITIDLDFGPGALVSGRVEGELAASWLHGAPARELRADVSVSFSQALTRFDAYPDHVFDDPARSFSAESQSLFQDRLDREGRALIRAELVAGGEPPGMLRAGFFTRVFEPGGAASIDRFALPFHPYRRYVGVRTPPGDPVRGMLLTDTEHRVDIALVDREGNPVPRGRVRAELFQINWRWWWEKGEEQLASYMSSQDIRPLRSSVVEIENGTGTWSFQVDHPSWGRYLVRVSDPDGGHAAGKIVYVDWPGWAGRDMAGAPGGASVLALTTDKPAYRVGDEAVLTMPTAREGRLLVSMEAGGRLLSTEWVEPQGEATTYRFEVTGEMAPNAYAHVSFVQPHLQAGNDMPIRMYGVVPIMVEDPSTRLEPVIQAADVLRPEEEAVVTVTEAQGRPMVYTLAVVDEGLLSLTRFSTPDPWSHFYSREANAVSTWDLYDQVAAAYGGLLEQLLAVGGGMEEGREAGGRRANRFPPLVRFLGPFELEENGTGEHRVPIPRYVGAVRIMCVAGMGGSFGSTSREALVRKPLMVLGSLPRVVSTREVVRVPVSVFVLEEGLEEVDVRISAEGALRVDGDRSRRVRMEGTGDTLVSFELAAGEEPGIGRVTLTAAAGGERAVQTIELDVRVPSLPVVDVAGDRVPPGGSWSRQVVLTGIPGTRRATLEVSRIPPIDLARRLEFLTGYPHGCIEQTISAVFPQLYLDRLVELDPGQADRVQRNVERGIARIRSFQAPGGGFGYWPGDRTGDAWSTSYAGHFLLEARDAGYAVDPDLLKQWEEFQRRKTFSWTVGPEGSELQQAYRLYTLALAGAPQLGAMNRLKEVRDLPEVARWRLAAAYHLAGKAGAARELTSGPLPQIPAYRELGGTYGSDLRDQAMILETLVVMNRSDRARQLIERISRELAGERWLSTQTTGYALLAIAKHAGLSGKGEPTSFAYSWSGRGEELLSSAAPIVQVDLPLGDPGAGEEPGSARMHLENTGAATLYTRVITEGTPPPGGETAARSGIALSVVYRSADGEPLEPGSLVQGTDVVAAVSVTHKGSAGPYRELALTHMVPSGWEITNARLEGAGVPRGSDFDYQDIRDDRIYTYFDLNPGETKTFRTLFNASYAGRFYLPLVKVEAMYDAGINARAAGRWVEVTAP